MGAGDTHRAGQADVASCTLADYSRHTALPIDELRVHGIGDGHVGLEIPYKDENGIEVRVRLRTALTGAHRFHWGPGTGLIPYGLWRLADARERGFITLVEGESDCHVLWHHGIPAIGDPGAGTWRNDWAAYFDGIKLIYAVIEPDSGGETLLTKLGTSPLRDRIRVIRLDGHEDPLDLHRADPRSFPEVWGAAMAAAALGDVTWPVGNTM